MQYIDKDWYGKTCPKVGFEIIRSTNWILRVTVPLPAERNPVGGDNQYYEGLWEQDVAEWFIVNPITGWYVECNLAASGAWWMMLFSQPRKRTKIPNLTGVSSWHDQSEHSWEATLTIPEPLLITCLGDVGWTHNVCFILGENPKHYLSLNQLGSNVPDFHRPQEILYRLDDKF